jgi:hypothetical protein
MRISSLNILTLALQVSAFATGGVNTRGAVADIDDATQEINHLAQLALDETLERVRRNEKLAGRATSCTAKNVQVRKEW